jgi:hypothetical protein
MQFDFGVHLHDINQKDSQSSGSCIARHYLKGWAAIGWSCNTNGAIGSYPFIL